MGGLSGHIELVLGIHDESKATMLSVGFEGVHDNVVVEVDGYKLWLNHFPPAATERVDHRQARNKIGRNGNRGRNSSATSRSFQLLTWLTSAHGSSKHRVAKVC
jgi:hypothetical protein